MVVFCLCMCVCVCCCCCCCCFVGWLVWVLGLGFFSRKLVFALPSLEYQHPLQNTGKKAWRSCRLLSSGKVSLFSHGKRGGGDHKVVGKKKEKDLNCVKRQHSLSPRIRREGTLKPWSVSFRWDVSRIRSLIIIISSSSITIAIIIILVSHPVCCRLFLSFFLDLTGIRFSVVYGYTFSCFSRAYTFLPFTGILQTLNNGWRCPWILTSCHATGSPDDDQICHK